MTMHAASSFGQHHFGAAALGHKKRTACLVRVADAIHRHPGGTLPHKLKAPPDYKAMDRLMNRPEVTHAAVLAPHVARTRERMRAATGPVLILHDTTELDFSGLKSIADLGPIGNGHGRGYLCHNSLAYDPREQTVIGLVGQILHRRQPAPAGEGVAAKRERAGRESRLWLQGTAHREPAPDGRWWVDVADRGADTFEFLAGQVKGRRSFLVRSCTNRKVRVGHESADRHEYLHDYVRTLPRHGDKEVTVHPRPGIKERKARISVAFAAVQLLPPHVRRGEYEKTPLPLWVVHVREDNPPKGCDPIEWVLLTSVPVLTEADAWERAEWYELRWVIEEYHKAQKTGCGIETLQFTSSQALEPMLALLSVVAVTLLNLREANRREDAETRPATDVIDPEYVRILAGWRYNKPRPAMTVREFYLALGRLGGHQNRKCDRPPGWLVLWRGWMDLHMMLRAAAASTSTIRGQT